LKNPAISGAETDPARFYTFGPFRLDARKRRLYRDGEVIPLASKVFDTLLILVRCSARVVEKDELMKLVWTDTFVTDDSLTQNISVLRKALGDTPDDPRFIVTVPRRGYRFSADVFEISGAETLADSAHTPPGREFIALDRQSRPPADTDESRSDVAAPPQPAGAAGARAAPATAPSESQEIANGRRDNGLRGAALSQRRVLVRAAAMTVVLSGLMLVGYRWWSGQAPLSDRPTSAGRSIRSLAVLPLENFSRDPDQEYVADGMTEALIGRLGGLRSLRVISRTSAMQFKGTRKSIPEIARELAVDSVVTGSVQRSSGRIRISVQLIRSHPEQQVWSDTYDRDVRDVLALQSEVALVIARQVDIIVSGRESARLTAGAPTVTPAVYDQYLKGRFQLNKNTRISIEESIRHFEAAITHDGNFAPAYLGLASAFSSLGTILVGASPPSDVIPKAVAAATRALELDPTLADAHVLLADIQQQEWRWVEAEAGLKRALELNPSHARAHASLGWWLLCRGRSEEAIASSRRGRDLDPLSLDLGVSLGVTYFMARRYDDAIGQLESILAIDPNDVGAQLILGMALVETARFEEAIHALELGASRSDRNPMLLGMLAGAYAHGGQRAAARRIVDELVAMRKTRYVTPGAFVFAYMGLGEHAQVFVWLERAFEERTNIIKFIKVNPMYDSVRADPRFVELVRRVGLD